jgi:hypoxanthine phosphoribosyltransferase
MNIMSEKKRKIKTFVLMPYGANAEYANGINEAGFIYTEIICPGVSRAAEGQDWEPLIRREMDRNEAGSITSSIVTSLVQSDIVIVDITGRNPNVFFELGIRYALRDRITILLAQEGCDVPFDIRGYRYISYNPFRPEAARQQIKEFILEGMRKINYSDSLVFEVFPTLSVSIPNVFESKGQDVQWEKRILPWAEYMERIQFHCRYLKLAVQEGHFVPHALIGITNGGLVTADIIGKAILPPSDIPLLALWASRFSSPKTAQTWYYFENEYNNAMTANLARVINKRHEPSPRIILIDDHLGTGQTSLQAINYLESRLKNAQIVFIPLVSRRIIQIRKLVEAYFPYSVRNKEGNSIFHVGEEEFINHVVTQSELFPYLDKEINRSTSGPS